MDGLAQSRVHQLRPGDPREAPLLVDEASRRDILERAIGYHFTDGNRIVPLRNGEEIFPEMLEAVRRARHTIAFITFVYWTGDIAEEFAAALADAAHRGVTVMVILDAVGAAQMRSDLIERLQQAGAQVEWFRPKSTWRLWRVSHRTHRKLLVVDHEIGFTGGVGIAHEWEGDGKTPGNWRDTHFRIEGPAVEGLWSAFVGAWMETVHNLPLGWNELGPTPPKRHGHPGNTYLQVVRGTASVGWSDISTAIHAALSLAERRIRIQTAYFLPDEDLQNLLIDKVGAGISVEIILPGPHQDQQLVALANDERLVNLIEAGAKIYTYQPSMMHAKILLVDDSLAIVGSANFNYRSLRKDDELLVTASDRELVDELSRDFDQDLELCEVLRSECLSRRPWYRRLLSSFVSMFRSEM